jgi:Zn-dependent protease
VTDYVLKYPDNWSSFFFTCGLPATLELLLYYTASLSAGLAVLNAVPCFMLDGQVAIQQIKILRFLILSDYKAPLDI